MIIERIHLKLLAVVVMCTMVGYSQEVEQIEEPNTEFGNSNKFYRGGLDDKVTIAPNGGKANSDYINYLEAYSEPKVYKPMEDVYVILGHSISNYNFIETPNGVVAFDAGNNVGSGQYAINELRKHTNKPIIAVIYSHHHYTGGASEYVKEGNGNVMIIGHPDVDKNLQATTGALGPMQFRRTGIQLGFYLSHEGEDAVVGPSEPIFEDPELNKSGHVKVNKDVSDGETVMIDGVEFVFYHCVSDTRDGLIVHIPERDMVLHNAAVLPLGLGLYTLRGDEYRDPSDIVASIDKMRSLDPTYLLGCHGIPTTSKEASRDAMNAHRDTYSFIYNQSIRAINQGKSPEEMVESIVIPRHLEDHPIMIQAYVDNEYNIRGQYRGLVGWYAEDPADLHPPTTQELGYEFIQLAGGTDKVIARANEAFEEKKYNLTAKILTYVLAVEPENNEAKQLKADACRAMAYSTVSGIQTRNFLLTYALHLEGKLDWNAPPKHSLWPKPGVDNIMATPVGSYLKLLESRIDPAKSANTNTVVEVNFKDQESIWAIHVRQGVAEVTQTVIPEKYDARVSMNRATWAKIEVGQLTVKDAIENGEMVVSGDSQQVIEFFNLFK